MSFYYRNHAALEHALTKYRSEKGLTLEAFASLVGAAKGMVWQWENGGRIPRRATMEKIIEITGGAVTANDWFAATAAQSEGAAE